MMGIILGLRMLLLPTFSTHRSVQFNAVVAEATVAKLYVSIILYPTYPIGLRVVVD